MNDYEIDPDNAYRFIQGNSRRSVSRRPCVLADATEKEDGWYYYFQGYPEGVAGEPEETLDGGPFPERQLALEELRNDVADWFFENGLDQKHIREDRRFMAHLAGEDFEDEDEEEDED